MRTEKFKANKGGDDNDDLKYAFDCNGLSEKLGLVDVIVAEVCGENDGASWYWVLQMCDGSFAWATGGCDCTGWDCKSNAEIHEGFKTPVEAIENIKVENYDSRKNIRVCLQKQINEEMPFALYQN